MLERLLRKKQARANYFRGLVDPSHRKLWLDDPVTKSLIATLEARLLLNLNLIMAGAIERDTIEEVALQATKAQEIARELEFIIQVIEAMAVEEKEVDTGGTQDSSESRSDTEESGTDSHSGESYGR
jgi:hypothetical protein